MNGRVHIRPTPGVVVVFLGSLIVAGLCLASAAHAAIGTPVDIGSGEADAVTTTSLSVTTTQAAPAGASVIVTATSDSANGDQNAASAACSDSLGHTYSTDVSQGGGSAGLSTICSTHGLPGQLPAGSAITVTWSAGVPPSFQRLHAFSVTGLSSAPLDKTAGASGDGTPPSTGPAPTTAQPAELLFGAISDAGDPTSTASFSPGTNGSANNCAETASPTYAAFAGVGSVGEPSLFVIHCTVAAIGAYVASATLGTGNPPWRVLLATYKAAATTAAPSRFSRASYPDPTCNRPRRLGLKLKRQKHNAHHAGNQRKITLIKRNIRDTLRRLHPLGC